MINDLQNIYLEQKEPNKSCLLALRDIILAFDSRIYETHKYHMPFFYLEKKMFCYLWIDKLTKEPYIGIVKGNKIDHPLLEQGNRTRIKIFRVDPLLDFQIEIIREILNMAIVLY
ncbi:MAG: DUF1801 domain-containing protein [Bacteroidales bacterium]|nr:DUF1801 domain-containing protein [Bacteroidales bacterium]